MYLNNSYIMLVEFLKYCYQKIFKPKSIKDNVIGSLMAVSIVYSVVIIILKFF